MKLLNEFLAWRDYKMRERRKKLIDLDYQLYRRT